MAYPTLSDFTTDSNAAAINWTMNLFSGIASGDLLVAVIALDGNSSASITGWTSKRVLNNSTSKSLHILAKVADGTEGTTVTVTNSASVAVASITFRATAGTWYGTINDIEVSTGAASAGTDANPDPDSLTVSWGSAENAWVACKAGRSTSAYPYASNNNSAGSSSVAGVCTTQVTGATVNPGTFTDGTANRWVAMTIGIRPAAAVSTRTQIPAVF